MIGQYRNAVPADANAGLLFTSGFLTGFTQGASLQRSGSASEATGITMKRTYQASKVRRARTHGFLVRMKTRGGRAVINARRAKGRKRLAV